MHLSRPIKFVPELDMKQKNLISSILNVFYRNEEMFISTMLVGNNIALVIYGVGMAMLLEPAISRVWNNPAFVVTMQTLLSTIIILFTGEFIPKTVFRVNPNLSLRFFSLPLYLIYVVLYPGISFHFDGFRRNYAVVRSEDRKTAYGKYDEQSRTGLFYTAKYRRFSCRYRYGKRGENIPEALDFSIHMSGIVWFRVLKS